MRCSLDPGALDAGSGRRACCQPVLPDGLAAPYTDAIRARVEPADGGVDLRDLFQGLSEQRGGVLPLEREGRAFRVVLVVGTRFARRRGDPGELPVQGRGPGAGTRTLRQQQFAGSRHLPDFRYAADESAGRAASIPEACEQHQSAFTLAFPPLENAGD
jgi:hypothetical protein